LLSGSTQPSPLRLAVAFDVERIVIMQWDFSREQVIAGEVGYTLEAFRKDYFEEIKANFSEFKDLETDRMFRIAYDVCYCVATNRELSELVKHLRKKKISSDVAYLELIRDSNIENIAMLKAIFAAIVSGHIKEGLSSRESMQKLDEYHKSAISDF
jgi:hypothetical protein